MRAILHEPKSSQYIIVANSSVSSTFELLCSVHRLNPLCHDCCPDIRIGNSAYSFHSVIMLSLATLILYSFVIFALYCAVSTLRSYLRLRHIPGPPSAATSWDMFRAITSGRAHEVFVDMQVQYGDKKSGLVRIGPKDLLTSDADTIRMMSSARSHYKRSNWYAARLDPHVDNLFGELDVKVHDDRKKQMAPGYAGKENPTLEADVDEQIGSFVTFHMKRYLSSGADLKLVDFAQKVQFFLMDVMTKISHGYALGYLTDDDDLHDYLKTMVPATLFGAMCCHLPAIQNFLNQDWVLKLLAPKPTDKKGMGKVMGLAEEVVAERYGPDAKERKDMLGAFVKHGLEQRQAQAEVILQLVAGTDTSATTIRSTMLQIISRPKVLAKLRSEYDSAAKNGKVSSPITNAEARESPYLQAVIWEGLRYYPAFPGSIMKRCPRAEIQSMVSLCQAAPDWATTHGWS